MMRHRCPQCHDEKRVFEPVILGRFLVHRCTSCRFFIDAAETISASHAAMLAEMETQRPFSVANDVDERRPTTSVGRYPRFELEPRAEDLHAVRTRSDAPTAADVEATGTDAPRPFNIARFAQPWLVAIALLGVCVFAGVSRTVGGAVENLSSGKSTPPATETKLGTVPFVQTAVIAADAEVAAPGPKNSEPESTEALSTEGLRAARAGAYQRARVRR